jgi:hypothetical protein
LRQGFIGGGGTGYDFEVIAGFLGGRVVLGGVVVHFNFTYGLRWGGYILLLLRWLTLLRIGLGTRVSSADDKRDQM